LSLFIKWLPVRVGNQRGEFAHVIPIGYDGFSGKKSKPEPKKKPARRLPKKHIIHKAIQWKKMLDDGAVSSMSEIARKEGLTRARVTQIMNLMKLPGEMQDFLLGLDDAKQIRKYSERKLRGNHEKDRLHQSISELDGFSDFNRAKTYFARIFEHEPDHSPLCR
jgi:hypothetical protein